MGIRCIKELFRRRRHDCENQLRMEGVTLAPITPEPDDAELAAQALLEMMCGMRGKTEEAKGKPSAINHQTSDIHDARYYHHMACNIRKAREVSRRRTARFLAYCERQLQDRHLPVVGPDSLALIEKELYKRIDSVEREGGELKRRWQHCLAKVTVRLMHTKSDEQGID